MLCFGCRFVFFFLSFRALLFVLGERSSVLVFSLSFFPSRGDRKPHHPFVSLSLSYEERAFWKTRSPSRMLRGTQKERGMIISEKEEIDSITRARKQEKKDGLDFSLIAAREPQPQRVVVASKTKTHIREQICGCYLPSAPAGHASKIHSSSVALIYIYMCVYSIRSL